MTPASAPPPPRCWGRSAPTPARRRRTWSSGSRTCSGTATRPSAGPLTTPCASSTRARRGQGRDVAASFQLAVLALRQVGNLPPRPAVSSPSHHGPATKVRMRDGDRAGRATLGIAGDAMSTLVVEGEGLLARARTGDDFSLGQLLERYRGYLSLLARVQIGRRLQGKADHDDLVQETFLEAARHFARFHGETERELASWL